MTWIRPLSPELRAPAEVIGAKAAGLTVLLRLGLPVPAGFVIGSDACRAYLRDGRLPDGLADELAVLSETLPAVSVRSGASESMPGMLTTVLNVMTDLAAAVEAVFSSWHTPRARTYRDLHGIRHDLGTAVIVQRMVFGDRDERSGTGVAFSRDPNTGEPTPYGDVLFRAQGEEVVSGRSLTRPLHELAGRELTVWDALIDALRRVEEHYRDACYLEFTYESGELWLLQTRPGRFVGAAAVRLATDLADEGVIDRDEALLRISPQQLRHVHTRRLAPADADILARGLGASPGVAIGRVATTAERAVELARQGPVILVRPETSPADLQGIAAAGGIVTARGGPASHAAVVARSMGKPAVVGVTGLPTLGDGTLIALDGTSGVVVRGRPPIVTAAEDRHLRRLLTWADEAAGHPSGGTEEQRLAAAQDAIRERRRLSPAAETPAG